MQAKELLAIFSLSLIYGLAIANARLTDQAKAPTITRSDQLLDLKGSGQVLGVSTESHAQTWQQIFF